MILVLRERLSDTNIFNGATAAETFDQFIAPLKRSEFDAKFYQKSHVKIDRSSNQKLQSRIQQLFNKERLESMFKLEKLLPRKDFLLTKVSYGSRCVQATCENNAGESKISKVVRSQYLTMLFCPRQIATSQRISAPIPIFNK